MDLVVKAVAEEVHQVLRLVLLIVVVAEAEALTLVIHLLTVQLVVAEL